MLLTKKKCEHVYWGATGATILAGAGEVRLPRPGPGPGFTHCFILCLEYIAKQGTCVVTPHVNAVNDVT